MERALGIAACFAIAACGRLHFDDTGDAGGSDPDASDRPNVAFVTARLIDAAFGGVDGADAICRTEAMAAGLPGTFVALLSTSTLDARDRLVGSRGWVGTTGAPIVDQAADLFVNGRTFGLVDHDANGNRLGVTQLVVWTGSTYDGTFDPANGTCTDWTDTAATGMTGFYARSAPFEVATAPYTCANDAHLYCFEVGHVARVEPRVVTGRIAFTSTPIAQPGLAGLDAHCQAEATAASLPGTYLAAVATTTMSVASRFAPGLPWRRVDGTQVSASDTQMFDNSFLLSTVHQRADGSYLAAAFVPSMKVGAADALAIGTASSTCSDWTSTGGINQMVGTPVEAAPAQFWGSSTVVACNSNVSVLCLQQ